MSLVTVSAPKRYIDHDWPVVSATIDAAGERYDVYMSSSRGPLSLSADPFVALALLPAMKLGAELRIAGSVSPRLLKHIGQMQEIISTWFRDYHTVPVRVSVEAAPAATLDAGVGCFFSGGIDSSYSALKHGDDLTHLIFVHGFDIALDDSALWSRVLPAMKGAAADQHKPLIVVETNCRSLLDNYAPWPLSHGAALASVALALSPQFQRIYVAASDSYGILEPYGSHPLLDPLWSTEQTEIVHDGCEMDRWQKLDHLVSSEAALRWLRVCWQNRRRAYNCGQCLKCIEAMLYLETAGALSRCPTFDRPLGLNLLQLLEIRPYDVVYTNALLAAIEREAPNRRDLAVALRSRLTSSGQMCSDAPVSGCETHIRVVEREAMLQQTHVRISKLEQRIHTMEESRSWQLTAPLRRATTLLQRVTSRIDTR